MASRSLDAIVLVTFSAGVAGLIARAHGEPRFLPYVLADRTGGVFVRGVGHGHPTAQPLPTGYAMVTAHDPNDMDSPRVARHLPRFTAAQIMINTEVKRSLSVSA